MQVAVVGSNPNHVFVNRTGCNGHDGGVVFGVGGVHGEAATFILVLFGGVVGCEIGADDLPGLPAIKAFVQKLAAVVNAAIVERILGKTSIPVEAQLHALGVNGHQIPGKSGEHVHIAEVAALRHGVAIPPIVRTDGHVEAIAKINLLPVCIADAACFPDRRRANPRAVVLHPATNPVRDAHVVVDVVKLRQRQVFREAPVAAAIVRNIEAAVVALDDVIGVVGTDPEGVVVGVYFPAHPAFKGFSAVFAFRQNAPEAEDPVFVFRIHVDFVVVERTVAHIAVFLVGNGHFHPFEAAVITFVQGVFFCLDEGVNDVGFRRRKCKADAPEGAFGQAVFIGAFGPGFSGVKADVEAGAGAA